MITRLMFFLVLLVHASMGQLKTVAIEEISLPEGRIWSAPRFSPSGQEIFFTTIENNGIWHYSFGTRLVKELTTETGSGFGFSVSDDGGTVAYRRTLQQGDHITRRQESVVLSLQSGERTIVETGNTVSVPVFSRNAVVSHKNFKTTASSATPVLLGIDDAKIVLLVNGEKKRLDPLNGQYVWPVLSPDREKIAAVEMDRGAFVCSIDGSDLQRLGKCNSPGWTNDGRWIIGMDDRDDGHVLLASDIIAVSVDGKQRYNLTESFSPIALFPSVSPVENKIVFSTAEGKVFLLMFEEVR